MRTNLSRRSLIAGGAAALPLAIAPAAASVIPVEETNPLDRVIRIARELSQALADWNGALFGGGPWVARVYPAGSRSHPISLEDSSAMGSPIMTLFEEWDAIYRLGFEQSGSFSDEECDAHCERRRALEEQMEAIPSRSAADLAAKIIAITGYGSFEFAPDVPANIETWKELERLVGRTQPELRGVS
ncbi:hypothetical protein [Mesorhizobium sp. CN2-181]|uniref:hypothetical protein n=1 Tax=Mesorhizobium yinganensis TaxID=3157707 RepID=UPI0032B7F506